MHLRQRYHFRALQALGLEVRYIDIHVPIYAHMSGEDFQGVGPRLGIDRQHGGVMSAIRSRGDPQTESITTVRLFPDQKDYRVEQ